MGQTQSIYEMDAENSKKGKQLFWLCFGASAELKCLYGHVSILR